MNKLIIALIAGTFATVAAAAGAPMTAAEKTKCADMLRGKVSSLSKQERARCADYITAGAAEGASTSGRAEAMDSAEAKAMKGTPKALPTAADKRMAVDTATKSGAEGASTSGKAEAMESAEAKAMKSAPKALPTKADKRKAVDTATKTEAGK